MANLVGIYDPLRVSATTISALGQYRYSNFGKTPVSAEYTSADEFLAATGALGDSTLARNRDRTGKIVLTFLQGSPDLAHVDALREQPAPFALSVRDDSGTPWSASSTKTVIKNRPPQSRAAEPTEIQVEFWCQDLTVINLNG